jgi:hypothetical protein
MKKKYLIFLFLSSLFVLTTGCEMPMRLRYQFDPPQTGEVLLQDDFSEHGLWEVWSDEYSVVDYDSDGLRFFVNQPNFVYWSRPARDYVDEMIFVKAMKVSGPDDNYFGVLCRYKNRDNFYYFVISSDGYYGIMKVHEGDHYLISADQLQYSEVIHQGDREENNIQAECSGPNLVLSVNDIRLAVAYDTDFDSGGVGLIVGTYDQIGVDILFDDFEVIQP